MNPSKSLITACTALLLTTPVWAHDHEAGEDAPPAEYCGLVNGTYTIKDPGKNDGLKLNDTIDLTLTGTADNPGWSMSRAGVTASGTFSEVGGKCNSQMMVGTINLKDDDGHAHDHAIVLFGKGNKWKNLYGNILPATSHVHQAGADQLMAASMIFNHNGQVHFGK